MKRVLAILLVACMIISLAACSKDSGSKLSNGELVDGKFKETKHIKVEVYDRDGANPAENNMYTDYIKKNMLEKYNVEVEFVPVSRWEEVNQINSLLAAQQAPDICYTYDYPTIQMYAGYGGVLDLQQYLTDDYKELLPNLWAWLGSDNLLYDQDPTNGTVWAIEGKRNNVYRINTFVRQDWLTKLGLAAPKTTQEFENMLVAFKDNAETLLGADADKMVPFSVSYDIGWRASNLIESKIDPAITDKEFYINGFDDRMYTQNGTKEAVKLLNKWYNMGLIWKDFALYPSGDSTEDDMMKAGYVGAFTHNYDYPFRNNEESINCILQQTYGPDAVYVAVNCFDDKNGGYNHYSYSAAGDRKAFFPATNKEPLACMLYLDFISSPETIKYLQMGEEGITYKMNGNAYETLQPDDAHVANKMNSGNNIDLTMTCNGIRVDSEEVTIASMALGYAGNDSKLVANAMTVAAKDAKAPKNAKLPALEEESVTGLGDLRDAALDKAVVCSEADFEAVWTEGMNNYLASGGQKVIDARTKNWETVYGSETMLK